MTNDEYRGALEQLTPDQLQQFRERWGGAKATVEDCVREYVYAQGDQRRQFELTIIHHLSALGVSGLRSEEQKALEVHQRTAAAAESSADAARQSAISAASSARAAWWALGISLLAIVAGLATPRC